MSEQNRQEQEQETRYTIEENGLYLVFEVNGERDVRLLHFSAVPFQEETIASPHLKQKFRLVEVHATGENQSDNHGMKHTGSMPGLRLKFAEHRDLRNELGRKLEIVLEDAATGLVAVSHLQYYDGIPVVRAWTELINRGEREIGLEYVTSFALTGLGKEGLKPWDRKMRLHVPHSGWYGEGRWTSSTLPELGLNHVFSYTTKRLSYTNSGTWSSSLYIPTAVLENEESGVSLFWQIEHNGSWHWEIGDQYRHLYLHLSGPTEQENHWWKRLGPGESFVSVPVAVGSAPGGIEESAAELTRYRRRIRRPHEDNVKLPVIFNDFMNCLGGDPTTEKLIPLIDAATETGCEYFTIDCGWYADGHWWEDVGEWLPSERRFPGGIKEPIDYIRSKGMIPGLWLELEVMGIRCPLAAKVSDDWFFCRHGKRVIDTGRYQLDYRNPQVIAHADRTIDRLVREYGVGYIKMDYNINAGVGTERNSDSFGDGLFEHNRAYLRWLDGVMDRYPELIIENCGSGGMRLDYALLSRHPIQSCSDQDNYVRNAVIAASMPSVVTPEQAAIWSYPLREGDTEEVAFNMVNALLLRVHQSGHLAELSPERRALVKEALDCYRAIRADIPHALPFWPLGLPSFHSPWLSLGLRTAERTYVAVWRLDSETASCLLPIRHLAGPDHAAPTVRLAYPVGGECAWQWQPGSGGLSVSLPKRHTARLFTLEYGGR